ncbi:hypothetical protein ETH41_01440 [Campylobacter upsaliensis]|nr:hypothetical protein [Campylobacter upsaliensis]
MGFLGYFGAFRLKGARTGLEFKAKIKTLSHSARVIHFRNLKRLRRFFSKGLNCFVMKGFKFLKKQV